MIVPRKVPFAARKKRDENMCISYIFEVECG